MSLYIAILFATRKFKPPAASRERCRVHVGLKVGLTEAVIDFAAAESWMLNDSQKHVL